MSNVLIWYFDDTADFCHDKERKDKWLKHLLMGELICSSTVVLLSFDSFIIWILEFSH